MVYDCFAFFNELDLLELRLGELNNVVDKFVLVEARFTHQGKEKILYFDENKTRFQSYHDKIIHIIVDEIPEHCKLSDNPSIAFENFQRTCIEHGLRNATGEDCIIVSDLDEILKPKRITENKNNEGITVFGLKHYAYYINAFLPPVIPVKHQLLSIISDKYKNKVTKKRFWMGPVMTKFKNFKSAQALRFLREELDQVDHIKLDSGWHFSYLGGIDKIIEKLNSIQVEFDYTPYKDKAMIAKRLENGEDIFGGKFFKIQPIDSSFPEYLVNNIQKFKEYIAPFN